jgi:uncharacterized membrane protein
MSPEVKEGIDQLLLTVIGGVGAIVTAAVGYVVWRFRQRLSAKQEKGKNAAPTAG